MLPKQQRRNVVRATSATPSSSFWSFASIRAHWILRLLLAVGVATLAADVVFLWPTSSSIDKTTNLRGATKTTTIPSSSASSPGQDPLQTKNNNNYYNVTHAKVLEIFQEAGITLTVDELQLMPTWSEVVQQVGPHPQLLGIPEQCHRFQQRIPAVERMIGSAGMFNSGTNLVTHLLKQNCKIPERVAKYGPNATREAHGIRWQVPWGKHTPAHFRKEHATRQAAEAGINKDAILPVITVRHPYEWMKSMCRNHYSVRWARTKSKCPQLTLKNGRLNPVQVKYSGDRMQGSKSLAHLWNDWYHEYTEIGHEKPMTRSRLSSRQIEETKEDYPWIMVRMEDLIFHAKETVTQVCTCIGGEIRADKPFSYIVESAKCDSPGHDCSTGMAQAWIKYGGGNKRRVHPLKEVGWTREDYLVAREVLDSDLMEQLGYQHPNLEQQTR